MAKRRVLVSLVVLGAVIFFAAIGLVFADGTSRSTVLFAISAAAVNAVLWVVVRKLERTG